MIYIIALVVDSLVPRGGTSRLDIITSSYTILTLDNYTKTQTYRFHKLLKLSLQVSSNNNTHQKYNQVKSPLSGNQSDNQRISMNSLLSYFQIY